MDFLLSKGAYKWLLDIERIYINHEKILNRGWEMYNVGMKFLYVPLEKKIEHVQKLIGLNNIYEYFVQVGTYRTWKTWS